MDKPTCCERLREAMEAAIAILSDGSVFWNDRAVRAREVLETALLDVATAPGSRVTHE